MIPKTIRQWYSLGPWVQAYTCSFDVYFTGPANLRKAWSYFNVVSQAHELAHVIYCKDDDIFDPLYGMEFSDNLLVPEKHWDDEIAVLTIQTILNAHSQNTMILNADISEIVSSNIDILENATFDSFDHLREIAQKTYDEWPIQRIYSEYCRKIKLTTGVSP